MSLAATLLPLVEFLEQQGVAFHVGGSVASSVHGAPRSTNDVDLVVDLRHEHVAALRHALGADYYAPEELLHEAIQRRSSANLIHLPSGYKIDLFVKRVGAYDDACLQRSQLRQLEPGGRKFPIATAEDIVLRKLQWYRDGGEPSDRQWSDILGVLRARPEALDRSYLAHWAAHLGLADLLAHAQRQAADRG